MNKTAKKIKFPEGRKNKVLKLIEEKKFININELINTFKTSRATIIRDLVKLENEGLITRSYGGVFYLEEKKNYSFDNSSTTQINEKKAIAKMALKLINEDDTIFLNPGYTTYELCNNILRENIHVYVVTNSLKIIDLFAINNNPNIFAIGGDLCLEDYGFRGQLSNKVIEMLQGDTAFIGIGGINLKEGLTLPISGEAELVSIMAKRTKRKVIMADYKKFGKTYLYKVNIDFKDIDTIITDDKTDKDYINALISRGIKVLVAKI